MSACPSGTKPCVIRIVRLDGCGVPVVGLKSVVVTKGFINIAAAKDYEEGQEFTQKNGCGELCISEKDCDVLKRINLTIGFCVIDHEGIGIMTSARLLVDAGGAAIGYTSGSTQCDAGWSLEIWQKEAGSNCDTGSEEWLYWAYPYLTNGKVGDVTLENGPYTFEVTAFSKPIEADDQWGTGNLGPVPVLPATAALIVGEHSAEAVRVTAAPPTAACGATALAA
jgi:hypothetical protein